MKKFKHFTAKNVGDYVVIDIHGDIVDTESAQYSSDVTDMIPIKDTYILSTN